MPGQITETLFSSTTILWGVAVAVAAALLFGSMTRRRTGLTDALREFVRRSQPSTEEAEPRGGGEEAGPE